MKANYQTMKEQFKIKQQENHRSSITIFLMLLLFISTSCKENNSKQEGINSKSTITDSVDFLQETLTCVGEKFNATLCFDNKKNFSITLNNDEIQFQNNNKLYSCDSTKLFNDLGYEVFLFVCKDEKIVLFDSFLENGHRFSLYYINNEEVKFLGIKEIISGEESSSYIFKVHRIDDRINIFLNNQLGSVVFFTGIKKK